jgi:hypothetical protein
VPDPWRFLNGSGSGSEDSYHLISDPDPPSFPFHVSVFQDAKQKVNVPFLNIISRTSSIKVAYTGRVSVRFLIAKGCGDKGGGGGEWQIWYRNYSFHEDTVLGFNPNPLHMNQLLEYSVFILLNLNMPKGHKDGKRNELSGVQYSTHCFKHKAYVIANV